MVEVKVEKVDNLKSKAIILVDNEEQKTYEKKTLEKYRQKKQLSGFRKGKAPDHLLKAKFAGDIFLDTVNDIINNNVDQIYEKSEHGIYAFDTVKEPKSKGDKLQFEIIFHLEPYVVLGKLKEISPVEYAPITEESDVEREVTEILRRHGKVEPTEEGASAVKGNFLQVEEEAWISDVPQGTPQQKFLFLGDNTFSEEIENQILEKQGKVGDEFSQDTTASNADGEQKIKHIVTIQKISTVVLPELTDEFVQEHIDNNKNVEQVKEDIRKRLENEFVFQNKEQENNTAIDKLISVSTFYFPENFIDKKVKEHLKKYDAEPDDVSKEELAQLTSSIENQQKGYLVYGKLLDLAKEKQNVTDTDELFQKYLERDENKGITVFAKELYQRYKTGGKLENQEEKFLDSLLHHFHTSFIFDYFKALDLVKKGKPQKLSFFDKLE